MSCTAEQQAALPQRPGVQAQELATASPLLGADLNGQRLNAAALGVAAGQVSCFSILCAQLLPGAAEYVQAHTCL